MLSHRKVSTAVCRLIVIVNPTVTALIIMMAISGKAYSDGSAADNGNGLCGCIVANMGDEWWCTQWLLSSL